MFEADIKQTDLKTNHTWTGVDNSEPALCGLSNLTFISETDSNNGCCYGALALVLSELDGVFIIKEYLKMAPKAFLSGQQAFTLCPTGFGKGLVKHCSA